MRFKRLMSFWIFILIIMVITLIGIPTALLGAENNQALSDEINKEAEIFLAEIYANQHGVTVDEALERFKLQDIAGKLSEDLITNEADTLAGYWIEHTPKFKLVILFTRDAEDIIKPYLQKYKELADLIEVGTAKISLVELQNIQNEVSSSAVNMGIPVDSDIDVYKNRVLIYVVDRAQFDRAVLDGKLILPDYIDVITVDSLATPDTEIHGGLSLSGSCTSGFAVRNSSGTKGITTAGHASNSQSYGGVSLPYQYGLDESYYDIQWHTAPGFTVTNKIKYRSDGSIMNITATKSRSQQWVGALVYKYGRTTGFTGGYISSLNYQHPGHTATFIRVNNTAGYNNLSEPGDSGGPWFTAYTAWGSHVDSAPAGDDPNDAIYMAINYVSGIGVSVMTSP